MPESHFGFMARKKPRAQPHPQQLPPGLVVRGPRPLEISNEDDVAWQRRCAKRNTAVQDIVKRRGEGALSLAPNPDDRTLNKRGWEHLMMVFRVEMRVLPPPGLDDLPGLDA